MDNPITNTLFRFVSRRSPKLPEEKDLPLKFIYQPESIQNGPFYSAVQNRPDGTSKWQALINESSNYVNIYDTVESLKDLYPSYYEFSMWLIRNRSTYNLVELDAKVAAVVGSLNIENLWNDLIYQIVSQESFYIKEAIMQLLLANHVVINYGSLQHRPDLTVEKYTSMLVNARIVISADLFQSESFSNTPENPFNQSRYTPYIPDKNLKTSLDHTVAVSLTEAYRALKDELIVLSEKYENYKTKHYNSDYAKYHENIVEPALNQFQHDSKEALRKYCEFRDPKTPYDPADACDQPDPVYMPDYENFSITYDEELKAAQLQQELSESGWLTLLDLLEYKPEKEVKLPYTNDLTVAYAEEELNKYDSYSELILNVEKRTSEAVKMIAAHTRHNNSVLSVGGVLIKTTETGDLRPFNFVICGVYSRLSTIFNLRIGVPSDDWQIYRIIIKIDIDGNSTSEILHAPTVLTIGNTLELNNVYTYTYPQGNISANPNLSFDLMFTNGTTKSIEDVSATLLSCLRGTATGADSVPSYDPTHAPFIPAGFGLVNLGTAAYKRVEQTLQCYVEGEVSQIENVLAREYREKSSRFLRRSEETTTISKETERENLRDTSTTERFEMHSEINQVIQESTALSGNINTTITYDPVIIDGGIAFAQNTSTENSMHQATTIAKELTERALDRVVTKVKEERIRKIVEEFEENNKHGYDNRKGEQHVTGVYRWVDKLYKNRIYNYGTRTMLEFMIPEPGRLHQLWVNENVDSTYITFTKPTDPRTVDLQSFLAIDPQKALYWASKYNVAYKVKPESTVTVGDSYNVMMSNEMDLDGIRADSGNAKVKIPIGYKATRARGFFVAIGDYFPLINTSYLLSLTVGSKTMIYTRNYPWYRLPLDTAGHSSPLPVGESALGSAFDLNSSYINEVPVSYTLGNWVSGDISVLINCSLTQEAENLWKLETFNAIIEGYERALREYNEKVKLENEKATFNRQTNPGFYRQIENLILKKNCISYLINQNDSANLTFGNTNLSEGDKFSNYKVKVNSLLSEYGGFVKFLEQAFEWNIMSYNFYPFYWGNRNRWSALYESDEFNDPIFRKFLQAGMARVVVTVRPGFEEAVNLYMSTGLLWNGGQIPVLGDPLYISLTDEALQTTATPEGKAWITRVPTALTILQAGTIGLEVVEGKALPCDCDPVSLADFENPSEIPCNDNFIKPNFEIGVNYEETPTDDEP